MRVTSIVDFLIYQIGKKPSAIVVMIHGHGKTNVVEENWYATRRSKFVSAGIPFTSGIKQAAGKVKVNINTIKRCKVVQKKH